MENQIRLRWTSHQGTVLSMFDALLSTETLVDVTLACEGQYLRAHKVVLSACSPYFQELLSLEGNKNPIIFLKDVKYLELKALIQYMYRGEVSVSQEELSKILEVAQALQIRGLADISTNYKNDTCSSKADSNSNMTSSIHIPSSTVELAPSAATTGSNFQFNTATSLPFPSSPTRKKTRMDYSQRVHLNPNSQTKPTGTITAPSRTQSHDPVSPKVFPTTDPLQETDSNQQILTGQSDYGHETDHSQEMYNTGNEVKLEVEEGFIGDIVDLEVEEEEHSMSASSFPENWASSSKDRTSQSNLMNTDGDGEDGPGGSCTIGNNEFGQNNEGTSFTTNKLNKRSSEIWLHFSMAHREGQEFVQCNYCRTSYNFRHRPHGNMRHHLRASHQIYVKKMGSFHIQIPAQFPTFSQSPN